MPRTARSRLTSDLSSFGAAVLTAVFLLLVAAVPAASQSGPNGPCAWPWVGCASDLSCMPLRNRCHRDSGALEGEACQLGYPCASGFTCEAGSQVCRGPGKEGDPCHATRPCGSGLTCEAGSHVCRAPGKVGDPCHATRPCGSGLNCHPGVHKCYHVPRWENEPCSSGYGCDSGLKCDAVTHVCTALCRGPTAEPAETDRDFEFSMIVMSDPQIGYCESEHCRNVVGSYERANELHAQSMRALADSATNFRGVIVNGDLTNVAEHDQLSMFRQLYEDHLVIYPGLGNHDYQNYLKKACSPAPGVVAVAGGCAKRMLDYMSDRRECNVNIKEMDYSAQGVDNLIFRSGSYSYYFDIGNYRFIQLQNHPGYEQAQAVYTLGTVTTYFIKKSLDWLERVLGKSRSKSVILNMHGLHASDALSDGGSYQGDYQRLKEIVGRHDNVVAIFAGHIHRWVGRTNFSTAEDRRNREPKGVDKLLGSVPDSFEVKDVVGADRTVPVLFGGGAEYNKYLRVEFEEDRFTFQVIDSASGTVAPVGAAETVSRWWPGPGLPDGYGPCAREGGTCSLKGEQVVYYGAGGRWNRRRADAIVSCDNATFGDPVYGTRKSCYKLLAFDDLVHECEQSGWSHSCDVPAVRERAMLVEACACEGRTLQHKATGLYRCEAHGAECGGVSFEETLGYPPNMSWYTAVP